MPETPEAIRGLADTMITRFTPPSFVPGCEVKSIVDISEYTTDNGWIEAIVGGDNQQRVRYYGTPQGVIVGDFVDVEYFPAYKLYRVFGATLGGTAIVGGLRVSKVWESDFGAVALQSDATGQIGIGIAAPQTLLDVKGGDDTNGPVFTLSTKDDMAITANDVIAKMSFSADDDSASREEVFYIRQVATGTWSSVARANYVGFGIMGGGPVFNDDVLVIRNTGDIGIGTIDPGGELHIFEASSGVATPNVNADNLIIESDGNAGISILTTANDRGAVMFGDPGAANQGQFRYDHLTDRFDMVAGAQIRMVIEATGNVGIGTTDPEGRLHTYDTIAGFLAWEFDGLDATVRTIIPNGTGDVLYRLTAMYVLRDSAAAVASGTTDISNSASVNLTVGGNTVRLRINADGSTDIARTAGSDTIKVALLLRWL